MVRIAELHVSASCFLEKWLSDGIQFLVWDTN